MAWSPLGPFLLVCDCWQGRPRGRSEATVVPHTEMTRDNTPHHRRLLLPHSAVSGSASTIARSPVIPPRRNCNLHHRDPAPAIWSVECICARADAESPSHVAQWVHVSHRAGNLRRPALSRSAHRKSGIARFVHGESSAQCTPPPSKSLASWPPRKVRSQERGPGAWPPDNPIDSRRAHARTPLQTLRSRGVVGRGLAQERSDCSRKLPPQAQRADTTWRLFSARDPRVPSTGRCPAPQEGSPARSTHLGRSHAMRDSEVGYHTRGAVDTAAPGTPPCAPDGASVPDPERRRPSRRAPETRGCASGQVYIQCHSGERFRVRTRRCSLSGDRSPQSRGRSCGE